jgi:predicted nuclease with RNAse H fold
MRTLGIDLAAQDKKTAWCAIEWISERALVELPVVGRSANDLLPAMKKAHWIGIDAPFGWPDTMVEAIHRYAHEGIWPGSAVPETLRYRTTDWFVHDLIAAERDVSVWPLSVSSDRAVCAWRCARLLTEYAAETGWKLDRIGVALSTGMDVRLDAPRPTGIVAESGVVEVYPAAALALWGLLFKGYKRNSGTPRTSLATRGSAFSPTSSEPPKPGSSSPTPSARPASTTTTPSTPSSLTSSPAPLPRTTPCGRALSSAASLAPAAV